MLLSKSASRLNKKQIVHQLTLKFTDYNRTTLHPTIDANMQSMSKKELLKVGELPLVKAFRRLIKKLY